MAARPFDDPSVRLEFVRRLNAIPGIRIGEELDRFPSIELTVLAEGDRLPQFLQVMDWAVNRVREAPLAT